MNEVIENHRNPKVTVFLHVGMSVLKHHQGRRAVGLVLRRYVDVIVPNGIRKNRAFPNEFRHLAFRNALVSLRIRAVGGGFGLGKTGGERQHGQAQTGCEWQKMDHGQEGVWGLISNIK